MLLDELKKLGKGMVTYINGRLAYIEFSELKPLGNEPFLIIKSKDVFGITIEKAQQGQKILLIPIVTRFSEHLVQSSYTIMRLSDLRFAEIIDESSSLYKMIVEKRSNLVAPDGKKIKM